MLWLVEHIVNSQVLGSEAQNDPTFDKVIFSKTELTFPGVFSNAFKDAAYSNEVIINYVWKFFFAN